MKTKIEIKSIFGDLIFEYEKENNTTKDTLLEAIKHGANLCNANLRDANLYGANLRDADLYDNSCNIVGKIEDWMSHDNIGSRKSRTLFFKINKGVFIQCGCFFGDLEQFVEKVKETHQGNKHERDYLALVEFIKVRFEL